MNDIFDEVDDILSDVESTNLESASSDQAEKNFNETELKDIMAEIESLEKEFESEAMVRPKLNTENQFTSPEHTEIQSDIDREMDMSLAMQKIENDEFMSSVEGSPSILPFEKKIFSSSTTSPSGGSEISFEAQGQMNLNLGFKIGEETVKLFIDPIKGLLVTMAGVELCINQEDGCKVTMESGVKFTIPLTSSESAFKKKSA